MCHPVTNNRTAEIDRPLDPGLVNHNILPKYGHATTEGHHDAPSSNTWEATQPNPFVKSFSFL